MSGTASGAMVAWIETIVGRSLRWHLARGAAVLAVGLVWAAPGLGIGPVLVFRNDSPSEPEGYYLFAHRPPVRRGEIVVLRDPPHFALRWLMKTALGVAGDSYCWDPALGTQRLDGRPMPPPDPAAAGLGIPVWRGCVTLAPGQLVGYGRSPDSYDSRYFGPVAEADLWGVYRPLWVGP